MTETKYTKMAFSIPVQDKNDFVRAAKARDQKLLDWVMDTLGDEYARMVATGEIAPRAIKKNRAPY